MSRTILIASPQHLSALHCGDLREALAFSANDTLAALDVIKNQHPGVIALEDTYAATVRGRALIERVEVDPALRHCQVRIVTHVAAPAAAPEASDRRRAPRFKVSSGLEVSFDGQGVVLVDVSITGAQVISPSPLRPNQRGKITLIDTAENTTRIRSGIAWASLELVGGAPLYRAGIQFSNPDTTALQGFIEAKKAQSPTAISPA